MVAEKESNDSLATAQLVPLDRSVAGAFDAGGSDFFAVELREGDVFSAEIEAVRLGGSFADAVLTVFGPDGQRIAEVDDTPLFHQDPVLTIAATKSGTYSAQVHESSYLGGDELRYVLHLGKFFRPANIFPPGGAAGQELALRLLAGAHVNEQQVSIKLPESVSNSIFEWREVLKLLPAAEPAPRVAISQCDRIRTER